MHLLLAQALLALTGAALAAPAATTSACPAKFTPYTSKFDDLGLDVGGVTHNVKYKTSSTGVYNRLYYSEYAWQVASPGNQTIQNDKSNTNFAMSANSGKGALVAVSAGSISNKISTYYGGEYFNVKSFWVRGQYSNAFTLKIWGTSYPPKLKGGYVTVTQSFDIPALANGQFYQVKLTAKQVQTFSWMDGWFVGDAATDSTQHILLDDFSYCFTDGS